MAESSAYGTADIRQHRIARCYVDWMSRVAIVTGATQGLGLALVEGLATRLEPTDTVYLTGRSDERIGAALSRLGQTRAVIRGERLDVADPDSAEQLATTLVDRHGGVDVVFSNAVMRIERDDDPGDVIEEYVEVNNLGATRVMRAFAPHLRDGASLIVVASTLGTLHYLAPVLHGRFDHLATLDDVDGSVARWRDEVLDGRAFTSAWPAFINIPSKVALVAAMRTLASDRRAADLERGVLVAAVCPGMIDTATSRAWFDTSDAQSPAQAAAPLLDLALAPAEPSRYGELIRFGQVLPWAP
jgi:NAD(P)-dependent dehydrogenase (short-subunit alcohol dehydrogenase family)